MTKKIGEGETTS
jgi:DnaJ homolog subfamily C member 8